MLSRCQALDMWRRMRPFQHLFLFRTTKKIERELCLFQKTVLQRLSRRLKLITPYIPNVNVVNQDITRHGAQRYLLFATFKKYSLREVKGVVY